MFLKVGVPLLSFWQTKGCQSCVVREWQFRWLFLKNTRCSGVYKLWGASHEDMALGSDLVVLDAPLWIPFRALLPLYVNTTQQKVRDRGKRAKQTRKKIHISWNHKFTFGIIQCAIYNEEHSKLRDIYQDAKIHLPTCEDIPCVSPTRSHVIESWIQFSCFIPIGWFFVHIQQHFQHTCHSLNVILYVISVLQSIVWQHGQENRTQLAKLI